MSNFELRFENPWLLLVFIPAVIIILVSHFRLPRMLRVKLSNRLPLLLRLPAVVLIVLLLAQISIITSNVGTSLLIMMDRSDSMSAIEGEVQAAAQQIVDSANSDLDIALAGFGNDVQSVHAFSSAVFDAAGDSSVDGGATDIASALHYAASAFPANTAQRVVLLTDGYMTDGDAQAAVSMLANKGIRMDAVVFDSLTDAPEVEVTDVMLPASAALGQPTEVGVAVMSNVQTSATLRIYDEETLLKEATVKLKPGENEYKYKVTLTSAGPRAFRAEIAAQQDTLEQNNTKYSVMNVSATEAILIVEGVDGQGAQLQALLHEAGYEADCIAANDMPKTLSALCDYSLIVLMNVNVRSLPSKAGKLLEEYVSVYGRSVLTTGGSNTYLLGAMQETPFESFLPVNMSVEQSESVEPVAVMLLIDNSASMEGTAIEMARRGAVKSIQALNDNDYVGVITFSSEHELIQEMTSMKNRADVITKVSGIGTIMGTMYTEALKEAYNQLTQFDETENKHVIMLSDGNPADGGYKEVVEQLYATGITVSTIASGDDISGELMQELANIGGGNCYIVESSFDLPSIMMTETIVTQVEYEVKGSFEPKAGKKTIVLPERIPPVYGYIRTEPKASADTILYAAQDHPLYTQWTYGTGLAGSYMSDLGSDWAGGWLQDEDGKTILLNIISDLLPETYNSGAVMTELIYGSKEGTLRVTSADDEQAFTADIVTPLGEEIDVSLAAKGNGVYERTFALQGQGKYQVTLKQFDNEGVLINTIQTAVSASWPAEYERFESRLDNAQMETLCAAAGGRIISPMELTQWLQMLQEDEDVFVVYDPSLPIAIAVFILLLADLLIRKIKLNRLEKWIASRYAQ